MKQTSTQLRVDCRNEKYKNASLLFGSSNLRMWQESAQKQHFLNNKNQKVKWMMKFWLVVDKISLEETFVETRASSSADRVEAENCFDEVNRCQVPLVEGETYGWLSTSFSVVFVFGYVLTSLYNVFSGNVYRSLNRPLRAMICLIFVTSRHFILRNFWLRASRKISIVQGWDEPKKQADGSCSQTMIYWHTFDKF